MLVNLVLFNLDLDNLRTYLNIQFLSLNIFPEIQVDIVFHFHLLSIHTHIHA
jgi:hypothetical protein